MLFTSLLLAFGVTLNAESFAQMIPNAMRPAFVAFVAPWCTHCRALTPTWTQLESEMRHEPRVFVAKVDCVNDRSLCGHLHVHAFPTLRTFVYPDATGVTYDGGKELQQLRSHIANLFTKCAADHLIHCNGTEKRFIREWSQQSVENIAERIRLYEAEEHETLETHNASIRELRTRFRKIEHDMQLVRSRIHAHIALLKSIMKCDAAQL